jgi:16S rRNA (cytosine967-C5)-methyltransferase
MSSVKIHPPILDAIVVCLKAVFEDDKMADKEVYHHLKQHPQFGSRDRSMFAETVYDIVRWKLKYLWQLEQTNPSLTKYKHLILISLLARNTEIRNTEVFEVTAEDIDRLSATLKKPVPEHYIEQSYPETFYAYCLERIGIHWHELAKALNQKPGVFIRVNALKVPMVNGQWTTDSFMELLKKEHIESALTGTQNCIQLLSKNNLKKSHLYKEGLFEFQDIGSQAIGNFLFESISDTANLNDITLLDLCAGAGGKTLHLSALLHNRGKIYATDYKASRLKNLEQRAEQAGCTNIILKEYAEVKQLKNLDCILIDAPCSGTGTFKRQPDLKYKVTPEKIQEYCSIQASLLHEYKNLLGKNGKLIYATCSVLPQENQLQIQHFLAAHPKFRLEKELQLLPDAYEGDGFYMACLSKL